MTKINIISFCVIDLSYLVLLLDTSTHQNRIRNEKRISVNKKDITLKNFPPENIILLCVYLLIICCQPQILWFSLYQIVQ